MEDNENIHLERKGDFYELTLPADLSEKYEESLSKLSSDLEGSKYGFVRASEDGTETWMFPSSVGDELEKLINELKGGEEIISPLNNLGKMERIDYNGATAVFDFLDQRIPTNVQSEFVIDGSGVEAVMVSGTDSQIVDARTNELIRQGFELKNSYRSPRGHMSFLQKSGEIDI